MLTDLTAVKLAHRHQKGEQMASPQIRILTEKEALIS